jgi:hypothetical protein
VAAKMRSKRSSHACYIHGQLQPTAPLITDEQVIGEMSTYGVGGSYFHAWAQTRIPRQALSATLLASDRFPCTVRKMWTENGADEQLTRQTEDRQEKQAGL